MKRKEKVSWSVMTSFFGADFGRDGRISGKLMVYRMGTWSMHYIGGQLGSVGFELGYTLIIYGTGFLDMVAQAIRVVQAQVGTVGLGRLNTRGEVPKLLK